MIPLAPEQAQLATRATIEPVTLAVLTVYSNKDQGTVDTVYAWSADRPIEYAYGGGSPLSFEPVIASLSGLGTSIVRVPSPAEFPDTTRQAIDLRLDNSTGLYSELRVRRLIGADLEIAELLLPPGRDGAAWDLRDLSGVDHVIRFRGEVVSMGGADQGQIEIRAAQPEPEVPWAYLLNQQENDPKDLGSRLPVPVGEAKRIRCRVVKGPAITTLAQTVDKTTTGPVQVTSVEGFPGGGTFQVLFTDELVECDGSDPVAKTINVTGRGLGSTPETKHKAGEIIVEAIDEVLVGVSGVPITALENLYIQNPFNQELVRVTSQYEVRITDSTSVPGATVSSVAFSLSDFALLLSQLFASAQVSVQPEFIGEDKSGITEGVDLVEAGSQPADLPGESNVGNFDEVVTPPEWRLNVGSTTQKERGEWTIAGGDIPGGIGSLNVKSYRLRLQASNSSSSEFGTIGRLTCDIPRLSNTQAIANLPPGQSRTVYGAFQDAPDGFVVSDLVGYKLIGRGQAARSSFDLGDSGTVEFDSVGVEVVWGDEESSGGAREVLVTRLVDTEILATSISFGLNFFADVRGSLVPVPIEEGAYDFDEDTGWNTANGTHSSSAEGQRITVNTTLFNSMENLGDWSDTSGGTISVDNSEFTEGAGSIYFDALSSSNAMQSTLGFASTDFSDFLVAVDVRPTGVAHLFQGNAIGLYFSNTAGITTNWGFIDITDQLTLDEWTTVVVDPSGPYDVSVGTPDPAAFLAIRFLTNAGFVRRPENDCWFDNVRLIPKEVILQRNSTSGVVDLTTNLINNLPYYAVKVDVTGASAIESASLYFENTSGTGTTVPVSLNRTLDVATSQDGPQTLFSGVTDYGAPQIDDVETIGLVVRLRAQPAAESFSMELQEIQRALTDNPNYDGDAGDLIQRGPDILRWWIADFCGLGHGAIDPDTWPVAEGHLGTNVFGGDLSGLGISFDEVIHRAAANMRASVSVGERTTGSVYRLHTSTGNGTWPAESGEVIDTDTVSSLSEQLLGIGELYNDLEMFYGLDRALEGGGENSYLEVLSASSQQNDTAVPQSLFDLISIPYIGRRAREPYFYDLIQDEATAKEILGWLAYANMDHFTPETWTAVVPHFLAYALEVGDTVPVQPAWFSSPTKAVVISIDRIPGSPECSLVLDHVF